MSRHRGFTLLEVLVVIFVLLVIFAMIAPLTAGCRARESANRMVCAANIRGIYVAMATYAKENADWFPVAGASDPDKPAVGFVRGLRGPDGRLNDQGLVNNITASLWKLIRNGSVGAKGFICPSSGNKMGMQLGADGGAMLLLWPLDFAGAENLSYSPINMYHESAKAKWRSKAASEDVVLGDNNNADGPGVHELSKGADAAVVAKLENSANHYGEGQSFGFADGHVQFSYNPFVGVKDDNVYAMNVDEKNVAPSMSSAAGDAVLLPITGNNGASLSGLPGPGRRVPPATYDWVWPIVAVIGVIGLAVMICLIADGVGRLVRGGNARAHER